MTNEVSVKFIKPNFLCRLYARCYRGILVKFNTCQQINNIKRTYLSTTLFIDPASYVTYGSAMKKIKINVDKRFIYVDALYTRCFIRSLINADSPNVFILKNELFKFPRAYASLHSTYPNLHHRSDSMNCLILVLTWIFFPIVAIFRDRISSNTACNARAWTINREEVIKRYKLRCGIQHVLCTFAIHES